MTVSEAEKYEVSRMTEDQKWNDILRLYKKYLCEDSEEVKNYALSYNQDVSPEAGGFTTRQSSSIPAHGTFKAGTGILSTPAARPSTAQCRTAIATLERRCATSSNIMRCAMRLTSVS